MKLGVICDGISRDLTHAIDVMDEFDLTYAELQFVGDKEVGDHSAAEIAEIDQLLRGVANRFLVYRGIFLPAPHRPIGLAMRCIKSIWMR